MLRNRWRSVLAGITVALTLVTVMVPLVAGANHLPPNDLEPGGPGAAAANDTPYWVEYLDDVRDIEDASCTKINASAGTAFVMPPEPVGRDWVLVVIKQGIVNYVYYDPAAGHSYPSLGPNAPGYSHVIVCSVAEQVTTTTAGETTTTAGETTTLRVRRPRLRVRRPRLRVRRPRLRVRRPRLRVRRPRLRVRRPRLRVRRPRLRLVTRRRRAILAPPRPFRTKCSRR